MPVHDGRSFKLARMATIFVMDNHKCFRLDRTHPSDLGETGHYLTCDRITQKTEINGDGDVIGVAFPL
jgi:hypothetical protein